MKHFIGLDVSLKETHVCVVDETGTAVAVCREATRPDLLASAIGRLAPSVERVVLETGGQSSWLQRSLRGLGVPTVIVDARQAKAALSCRLNKTKPISRREMTTFDTACRLLSTRRENSWWTSVNIFGGLNGGGMSRNVHGCLWFSSGCSWLRLSVLIPHDRARPRCKRPAGHPRGSPGRARG